jgi:ketosteroid isomerase-like protein
MRRKIFSVSTLLYSLAVGLVFSMTGCTNTGKKSKSPTPADQEKELREVMAKIDGQNKRFERFYLNGQADSLELVFDKNVRQYLAHQPPANSLEELIETSRLMMSWGQWEFDLTTEEVKLSGPMAVERGRYQYTFTPNEESPIPASQDSGNYIVLWEKIDGEWKIVWDAPVTEIPLE